MSCDALRLWEGPDNGTNGAELHDLVHLGTRPGSATSSPCIITMDLDEIVCFMTD